MVSATVITALLIGFLAGVAAQHTFTTASRAWHAAQEKAAAKIKPLRWDG